MTWHGKVPFKEVGMNEEKYTLLKELAEDDDYWKTALSFIEGVSGKALHQLSLRQVNWLYEIDASLGVELNRREAMEAFNEG